MHSQNGTWENESRDRGSNWVTEKTTLVVARLQSVKQSSYFTVLHDHIFSSSLAAQNLHFHSNLVLIIFTFKEKDHT
jgi:hypothetical protein